MLELKIDRDVGKMTVSVLLFCTQGHHRSEAARITVTPALMLMGGNVRPSVPLTCRKCVVYKELYKCVGCDPKQWDQ